MRVSVTEIEAFQLCEKKHFYQYGLRLRANAPEATSIAKEFWARSPYGNQIELKLGPALDTLQTLEGPFDLVFIDADKENYEAYYERILLLLRSGGLLLVDNVLWSGKVADPDHTEESTLAIRAFNRKVHEDDRVSLSMLPIGDGMTLVRKRA